MTKVTIVIATSSQPISQQPINIPQVPPEVTDVPEHVHQPKDNNAEINAIPTKKQKSALFASYAR